MVKYVTYTLLQYYNQNDDPVFIQSRSASLNSHSLSRANSLSEPSTSGTAAARKRAAESDDTSSGSDTDEGPDPGSQVDLDRRGYNDSDLDLDEDRDVDMPPASDQSDPELPEATAVPNVADIRTSLEFIKALKDASLDDEFELEDHDESVVERLRQPPQEPLDISDGDLRLSIDLFLSATNASEQNYVSNREAIMRRHPEDEILSYASIKAKIAEMSGVTPLVHDMCINSCAAFTGPFASLQSCPICSEARFEGTEPRRKYHTIPIGPQLQALWRTKEGAQNMRHRSRRTAEIIAHLQNGGLPLAYDDVYHGQEYLEAVLRGDISTDDMVLLFSIDGAQLYAKKLSDCWIYIWVIFDYSPDLCYKKKMVLPGSIIPGPNKPKHPNSFLFPGLHHLAALQKEGLVIWDAYEDRVFRSYPYLMLATADGPGMTYLNGLVGHQGAYACRLYCPVKGRHKPNAPHYYPALLLPDNYTVEDCNHADINIRQISAGSTAEYAINLRHVLESKNETEYKRRRKETGISKPSLFSGLPANRMLGIPGCFPADLMHLVSLNLTDLFLSLWRGTLDCDPSDSIATWDWAVLQGDVWKNHGKNVADATPYLPGSFDRPPRNPAEKISSGYKAREFLTYVFILGPGVFLDVLPDKYWSHFCKLVAAIRLLHQRSITPAQLVQAHSLIIEFVEQFELMYYQRKVTRLHFCRPSLHGLLHIAPETQRIGPEGYYSQWTMERTIGNLGEEIKQHSNPFANLSQRGIRRSQVNALKAMVPDLDPDSTALPKGAMDLGSGYILLRAKEKSAHGVIGPAGNAIRAYYEEQAPDEFDPDHTPRIIRWARLRLPCGQIACSAWKEKKKTIKAVRISQNVKVCTVL